MGLGRCDHPAPTCLPPHALYEGDPNTGCLNQNLRTPTQGAPAAWRSFPWAFLPAPPSYPGPHNHQAEYLEAASSSRELCASFSDQPTLRSGSDCQGQGKAAPSHGLGPPAWVRQQRAPFTKPNLAGQRPGPQHRSRDHPRFGGVREQDPGVSRDHPPCGVRPGPQDESRDHPHFGGSEARTLG